VWQKRHGRPVWSLVFFFRARMVSMHEAVQVADSMALVLLRVRSRTVGRLDGRLHNRLDSGRRQAVGWSVLAQQRLVTAGDGARLGRSGEPQLTRQSVADKMVAATVVRVTDAMNCMAFSRQSH
jgi:hypothetical protein